MKSVTLKIAGMHCDGCAQTVKALLERAPGVKTAAVAFGTGEARIHYDPGAMSEERLITMIERPGYRVTSRAP